VQTFSCPCHYSKEVSAGSRTTKQGYQATILLLDGGEEGAAALAIWIHLLGLHS
jgi:hypothetical protein